MLHTQNLQQSINKNFKIVMFYWPESELGSEISIMGVGGLQGFKQQYQQQESPRMQKSGMEESNYQQICTSIVNFIPLEKIGEGSFSSVYKVRRITDDCIYALKKIKISALKEKQKQNALNQIRILASLDSPHIVQYRQAFFDHKLNLLCIVMEFANDGDLQKKVQAHRKSMKHIPENEVWKAAYHTIRGLDILHSNAILHRDIKSANIFINDGVYKLGDLNVSKVQDHNNRLAYTQTGTPYYASPEVWRDEPYDNKSDIWSLGCVLYEMCTFRPPFKGKDLETLYRSVQAGFYEPLPIQYSQELGQLIGACLRLNPKQRLSCKQLLSLPLFQKKCYELKLKQETNEFDVQLLKTIKLPSDLRDLKRKLPKSKYSSSIDNITYRSSEKKDPEYSNQRNQAISSTKKYSHQDYYLQMAKKKKEIQYLSSAKMNRVISEGTAYGNPEENNNTKKEPKDSSLSLMQGSQQISKESAKLQKGKQVQKITTQIRSIPCSDRSSVERNKRQTDENDRVKQLEERRYVLQIKNDESKLRKLSHDQESERKNGDIVNSLCLIKKLSQPSAVNNCLSQRYLKNDLMVEKSPSASIIETERYLKNEKMLRRLVISKKNDQLMEIEKKVEEKRKELRKIGSIQRLQAGSHKNIHNLSYRPTPSLVLHSNIKKSAAHVSNILLKSPGSTQDEPNSSIRGKEKSGSQKKLMVSPPAHVSSTPYIMRVGDAPRMKRMLQNINETKKCKDSELKSKILSSRYLPHC